MSSKDSEETHTMHTKSDNTEIMMGNDTDEIIKELFKSLLQSDFGFDSVGLLYYRLQKVSLKRGR